ncbi:extracellular solute-binding protein [Mangrovicella endophytica]|uniref:extracellular solute-binding protein n=1 Tax=Mangrovicella endophytica TaxID=2066697 RepID=UPI000C9E5B55|nr:extracellular solute-binding protein [Mangrovicella endophytica]
MTMLLSRRRFTQLALAGAAGAALRPAFAAVPADTELHGLSAFGDLKYSAGFAHFDYASPQAPSGGRLNLSVPSWILNQSPLTFDTLNTFVLRGNAPPRIELLYDTLMVSSLDEPDALYGALAESVSMSADRNRFTFRLRPEARFSTGAPVTADDVAFSYETLKKDGHPSLQVMLAEVTSVTASDERTAVLTFSGRQNVAQALGTFGVPIIPRAFFAGRGLDSVSREAVPGSGQYRIGRAEFGTFIEYEKRDDYWAKDLPFVRGLNHFQTIRIDFFRDRQPALEAFKKGLITVREEFTTKDWATQYDFPAVTSGAVVRQEFPDETRPHFQCWALNQRRERFTDARVRHAINLCFDFEWTNANLLFGQRVHSQSPFEGSDFVATGEPSEAERALLEPLRGKVPDEVFGPVWTQPVTDASGADRVKLREAAGLFAAAGWARQGRQLVDAKGEPFRLEYMTNGQEQGRVYGKFIDTLRLIGVDASIRLVDAAQYQERVNRFDFDMILAAFSFAPTPTQDSLAIFFGSAARDNPGAYNYPGMASEAVDALIAKAGAAQSREELTTVMKALDRLLRWRLDWLPNITSDVHRVAYWNMFGFKEQKPEYGFPIESLWWYDAQKAAAIGKA